MFACVFMHALMYANVSVFICMHDVFVYCLFYVSSLFIPYCVVSLLIGCGGDRNYQRWHFPVHREPVRDYWGARDCDEVLIY